MSGFFAVIRSILELFSLSISQLLTASHGQKPPFVTISSAKKCSFPKSFGRIYPRSVFLLLPKLATVFKEKNKTTDKSMWEETSSNFAFFHGKFQNLLSITNKSGQENLQEKVKKKCIYIRADCFLFKKQHMIQIQDFIKSFVS